MAEKDTLQRFLFANSPVRGEFIRLEQAFQTIVNQHPYPASVRRLLGEALCIAGLLSAIIKFNGRLTVQFRGNGKLKLLLAQCDNEFHLRGLVKWEGDSSYEELMESFKEGVLVIMIDSNLNTSRYQGIVSWRGNSLVESIEGYFKDSEQLATKIWLSVNEKSATAFLLQVVPISEKEKDSLGVNDAGISDEWSNITEQAKAIENEDLLDLDFEGILSKLFPHEEIRVFKSDPVSFQCTCSRKRGMDAILILGKEEAEAELKNNRTIIVTCDFCNKEYIFDRAEVKGIFNNKDHPPSNTHLH